MLFELASSLSEERLEALLRAIALFAGCPTRNHGFR
jgi:hypothetical protein